jgi:hypothetical protein
MGLMRRMSAMFRREQLSADLEEEHQWQSGPCGPATLAPSRNATDRR